MPLAARMGADGHASAAASTRWYGAHAMVAAASAFVALPDRAAQSKARVLLLFMLLILGAAAVVLSPGPRAVSVATAAAVVPTTGSDRRRARLRWTGFHALLFLGASRLLLDANAAAATAARVQVFGAYALFMVAICLVLVSTFYRGVPRASHPAAAAVARELDGFLFGGQFTASNVDD